MTDSLIVSPEQPATPAALAPNQLALWLGQQHHPDSPIYNMAHAFVIHGSVDPARFQAAFQRLVDKSDALRLVIRENEGEPRQYVIAPSPVTQDFIDLTQQHKDTDAALELWLEERRSRPLDLSTCHYDVALLKLADDRFVWYYNHHHISCDILSIQLAYRYLSEIYAGQDPEIPSYLDHVERIHQRPTNQKATEFWTNKLAEQPAPTDFYGQTIATATPQTERRPIPLGPERSSRLHELAQADGLRALTPQLSLMNIFTAALAVTLHRIGGQETISIGSPFHNRPTPVAKQSLGLFIQLYPIFVELNAGETLRTLAPRIQRESLSNMRYAPNIEQNIDEAAAFDVVLNYLTVNFGDFAGIKTDFHWVHAGHGDSNHALRLQVHDFAKSGEFALYFDLNNGVFSTESKEWIIRHFLSTLDALIADPDATIASFDLLTDAERHNFLTAFNNTASDYPSDKTVIDLFEAQVKKQPNAIAATMSVGDGETSLTYAELSQRANTLAATLVENGVTPGGLVGLCTHRSLETLIGILAALKAGAAYVPIDPTYPAERIQQILDDINAPVILTHLDVDESGLRRIFTQETITISAQWSAQPPSINTASPDSTTEQPPTTNPQPADLAYTIFTSGSTGRPKGAMVTHQGLTNYATWAAKSYANNQPLSFPLFSSLSFDLTVTSIFVPLITGGKVVIYREDDGANDLSVLRVLQENQVDIIKLTPAHLSLLNEVKLAPSRLQKMIVGGEDFKTQLALQTLQLFGGDIEIYNEYGPTEATVGCMIHRFDPSRDIAPSVPIGQPADNAQITVVDQYGNPVPTGVIGEMVISGNGIAKGYLNRPELTAEKFKEQAASWQMASEENASPPNLPTLHYHTGDLARWLPSGQLEFLGRADHQVKLRGYRVELGEIEAGLLEYPTIKEAVVTLVEPSPTAQSSASSRQPANHCSRCGLPDTYPNAIFDAENVCHLCRRYETYEAKVQEYFHTSDDLAQVVERIKASGQGESDCIMLMSGGKDSTYVLYQLVQMGLRPLVFTLDNGYISDQAKGNIRRVVEHLGLEHIFATTPHMNAIFVDSLKRHCNVCNGCFKAIYTMSMQLAQERGIKYIVTGLARGQLFETRLTEELFLDVNFDVDRIDQQIMEARKAYHRQQDLIAETLSGVTFANDAIFDEIEFVDFYRYTDVELDQMLTFLAENAPWIRPGDTGRSTNCLINDVGIYVHKQQRGYHNYALPYSWDVRLGHKERDAALHELDDEIDESQVHQILDEIGYDRNQLVQQQRGEPRLVAYITSDGQPSPGELREHLSASLPVYMLPTDFVQLEQIPLTINGKVDRAKLPAPESGVDTVLDTTTPESDLQELLAEIWQETLHMEQIGIHTNFFDIGGTSLPAIQIVARISQEYDINFQLKDFFAGPTIAQLSQSVEDILIAEIDAMSDEEVEMMLG